MKNKIFKIFFLSSVGMIPLAYDAHSTGTHPLFLSEKDSMERFWESRQKAWAEKGYERGEEFFDAMRRVLENHEKNIEGLPQSNEKQRSLVDFSLYILEMVKKETGVMKMPFASTSELSTPLTKIQGYTKRHNFEDIKKFLIRNYQLQLKNIEEHEKDRIKERKRSSRLLTQSQEKYLREKRRSSLSFSKSLSNFVTKPALQNKTKIKHEYEPLDFWSMHKKTWFEAGGEKSSELFDAFRSVFDDPGMKSEEDKTGRIDGLPSTEQEQRRLIAFAVQVLKNTSYGKNLEFLTPHMTLHNAPKLLRNSFEKKTIREQTRVFLSHIQEIQHYTMNHHFSIHQAVQFLEFLNMWNTLPAAFTQTNKELAILFRDIDHQFPETNDQIKAIQVLKTLSEVTDPMDFEHWGSWKNFVDYTIHPLVALSHTAELEGHNIKDVLYQEGEKIAFESFKKRIDFQKIKIKNLIEKSDEYYLNKISHLRFKQRIFYGKNHETMDPFEAVLKAVTIYPDGKLFSPYPYSQVLGKRYRIRYEAIYSDPYAEYLDGPDAQLRDYINELVPLQNKGMDQTLSERWYAFKESIESDLKNSSKAYVLDLFKNGFKTVWEKLDREHLKGDETHQRDGKFAMARLFRLFDAIHHKTATPEEAWETFYMAVAQNMDGVGVRCIDGIHEFLNDMEHDYVYTLPKDAEEETMKGVILAKILRDGRYETLHTVLEESFPLDSATRKGVGMEVRTYGFFNTLKALRHPFGLGGQDPETAAYPFPFVIPVEQFLEFWAYGGSVHLTEYGFHHFKAFTPDSAAELVRNNVGMGKPISPDLFDALINWDLDLRNAHRQWKMNLSDGQKTFENDFFQGEDATPRAMKNAGYIKILERFGYVAEYDH